MARNPQLVDDEDHMKAALTTLEQGGAARLPGGQVISERTIFGDIITAQPIKVPRNEANVLRRVDAMAQANGEAWYYRYPVKKKGGGIDYIEGPSIECADAVARYYGNCQVQTALAAETTTQWIFASRFVDLETGYSLIRPFLQPKRSTLGGEDDERRLQMAFGIGTSKCQRNVVDHALADVMDRAFKAAKASLVERIGKRLPEARTRILERLRELGGDELIRRVEQVYQRKPEAWLAPDVARLYAEVKAVQEGMALADEVWPLAPPPEPRRDDKITDVPPAREATAAATENGTAAAPQPPPSESAPPAASSPSLDAAQPAGVSRWRLPDDLVGQDAIVKALYALIEAGQTDEDFVAITTENAERIAKFSEQRKAELGQRVMARRELLAQKAGEP